MSRNARLILDAALFVAFAFAYSPAITGITVHEWLSIALLVPAFAHLVLNWEWTLRAAASFAGKLRNVSRVNLVIDVTLFVATVTVTLSGLMVSQAIAGLLGVTGTASAVWHVTHSLSADATIVLFALHTALHAGWIANAIRSLFAEEHRVLNVSADERSAW